MLHFVIKHDEVSPAALYANLLERLGFFLPQLPISKIPARQPWRLSGKLYLSKAGAEKSVYTLIDGDDRCWIKIDGAECLEGSACLEQILGKLTLMYGSRQNFGVEGVDWEGACKLGSVTFGGEAESVILEVNENIFQELSTLAFSDLKLTPLEGSEGSEGSEELHCQQGPPVMLRFFSLTRALLEEEPKRIAALLKKKHKLNDTQLTTLQNLASLKAPATAFPFARAMKRRIIAHLGPTNSGKTYAAIEALKASGSGVYCAPLRLLAQEMFDKLNAAGTPCSLRTGELTKLPQTGSFLDWKDAPVISCTVEMLNLRKLYKVAVIDEIQLLADAQRGWAFAQALLGCCAERIYVCGELAAKPLITKLAQECGEEVEFVHFERLTPLQLEPVKPRRFEAGDCVVTFSRKNIFRLRDQIQANNRGAKVAVVYGALPAENRALQAAQFNEEKSSILVASDAIGMGLNLNIKRIIFDSLTKFDGQKLIPVPEQQIRQIAGRAGRFKTAHEQGLVTCAQALDFPLLQAALKNQTPAPYRQAFIAPSFDDIERLQAAFPRFSLADILDAFVAFAQPPEHFCLSEMRTVRKLLQLLQGFDLRALELEDLFTFLSAPVKVESDTVASAFLSYATYFVKGLPCPVGVYVPMLPDLLEAEETHKALEVYLWLNTRFPHHFPFRKEAELKTQQCCEMIERLLNK